MEVGKTVEVPVQRAWLYRSCLVRNNATMEPLESIAEAMRLGASVGLIEDATPEAPEVVGRQIGDKWGIELDDLFASVHVTDKIVLDALGAAVIRVGLHGYTQGDQRYVQALEAVAARFGPTVDVASPEETWSAADVVEVRYRVAGVLVSCQPLTKYFDASVLAPINNALDSAEPRRLFHDGEGFVALVTDDQAIRCNQERGWSLTKAKTPNPSSDVAAGRWSMKRWKRNR